MQNCKLCVLLVLIGGASVLTAPQDGSQATILQYENDRTDPNGGYRFSYLTSDGTSRDEVGEIKNAGSEDETLSVVGEYAYQDTNGQLVMVSYKADEEGYQVLKSSMFTPLPDGSRQSNNNGFTTSSLRAGAGNSNSAFPNRGTPIGASSDNFRSDDNGKQGGNQRGGNQGSNFGRNNGENVGGGDKGDNAGQFVSNRGSFGGNQGGNNRGQTGGNQGGNNRGQSGGNQLGNNRGQPGGNNRGQFGENQGENDRRQFRGNNRGQTGGNQVGNQGGNNKVQSVGNQGGNRNRNDLGGNGNQGGNQGGNSVNSSRNQPYGVKGQTPGTPIGYPPRGIKPSKPFQEGR